jgi:hypothetical protein
MLRRSSLVLASVASLLALLGACNSITGINDLPGSGAGAGEPQPPPMIAAKGVSIGEVALYQTVKRSFFGGTPPTSGITVPTVAGRPALLRVFTTTDPAYDKSAVTARLTLGQDAPIEVVGVVSTSTDAALTSTINFDIPADKMVVGQTFRVDLLQSPDRGNAANTAAGYPGMGTASLDVQSDGLQLKVMIVPVRYGADGSKRLPDTTQQQLDGYKNYFFSFYPAASVEITVREPWTWNQPIDPSGGGWSEVLDAVAGLRQTDHAPADLYYFGAFEPAGSFDQFCAQGCVAGLGMVGTTGDTYSRAAVGVGYPGDMAWTTAIHETGHNQGRNHADCGGAQGIDPKFPYPQAGIGVWGYDLVNRKLVSPLVGKDMMGYCDPYWISDYTYKAIFDRMKNVNKAEIVVPPGLANATWERARLDGEGNLTWLDPVTMERPPLGEPMTVTELRAGAAGPVQGQFFPYDHVAGGVLLWPRASDPITGIALTVQNQVRSYRR